MKNYIYVKLSGFDSVVKEVPNQLVGGIIIRRMMRRGLNEDEVKFPAAAGRPELIKWAEVVSRKMVN